MNILVVNDDGIFAPGIICLAKWLSKEHDVTIVAPESNRSFASHSLTHKSPIQVKKVRIDGLERLQAFSISGTPADCVTVGLSKLVDKKPDAVLSGINSGENLSTDVLSSGTVNAAACARTMGFASAAISLTNIGGPIPKLPEYFEHAGEFSLQVARALGDIEYPGDVILNVNIPYDASSIKGVKVTELSACPYFFGYKESEREGEERAYKMDDKWSYFDGSFDGENDFAWNARGYITITPVKLYSVDSNLYKALENFGFKYRSGR